MKYSVAAYAEALASALDDAKNEKERQQITRRFLVILRSHKASFLLLRIVQAMERRELKNKGLKHVEVTSASPLTDTVRREISAALGEKVSLTEIIRSELLGGIRILVEDEILVDASAKTQLERMLAQSV